jgi:hypothetical protein
MIRVASPIAPPATSISGRQTRLIAAPLARRTSRSVLRATADRCCLGRVIWGWRSASVVVHRGGEQLRDGHDKRLDAQHEANDQRLKPPVGRWIGVRCQATASRQGQRRDGGNGKVNHSNRLAAHLTG